jgi:manganese transport protein
MRPWLRRLVTRLIAIVPAVIVTAISGASGTAKLLVFSQVVLSIQLSFAVIPLIIFTSDRRKMGQFASPRWLKALAWITAAVIVLLNGKLLFDAFGLTRLVSKLF